MGKDVKAHMHKLHEERKEHGKQTSVQHVEAGSLLKSIEKDVAKIAIKF